MQGVMRMSGDWSFMSQALLNGVYDSQSSRRGDDKASVSGTVMEVTVAFSIRKVDQGS